MPVRTEPWPTGTPCWVDLAVPDLAAAKEFYAAVLGWTYLDTGEEFGNYQIGQRDGHAAAGVGPLQNEGQPVAWTTYLASDDVDGTAKLISENGGTLLAEPFDVLGSGRLCLALDPQGAPFGVWQAAHSVGAEVYNEPGALVWSEVGVSEPDPARQFYAAVFGYSYQPVEGAPPSYTTFHRESDAPLGGIGGLDTSRDVAPQWLAYFMVADADAAVAAATERDATVIDGPVDTPYGRLAVITDRQGATFAIMGRPLPS
ncbi:MAG TPA: VOC family protein [Pseudonocardiaceae bacterium]